MTLTSESLKFTALCTLALAIACLFFPALAYAAYEDPELCTATHLAKEKKDGPALGFAPSEVEQIVSDITRQISFQAGVKITFCESYVEKVVAWRADNKKGIPDGNYIVINQVWFREVIGKDKVQAIALIGHELGHITNFHLESRKNIPRIKMETEADLSAGCAIAMMGYEFAGLENFLYKIRAQVSSGDYPSRADSIAAARKGHTNCSARAPKQSSTKAAVKVAANPDTVGIAPGKLRAVDYIFEELNGVGVQIESEDEQWVLLDGTPISPVVRFNRILGGSFPTPAKGKGVYHNNIYLPDEKAAIAKARGQTIVQLRHWFNVRDENGNVLQVPATLRIHIQ
jgi:hypothetical protein